MSADLSRFLDLCRAAVDEELDRVLPDADAAPTRLHQAMRYAVLSGGKRLRPALAFGAAAALGEEPDAVRSIAAAVELVHAYSLVHDDLPAMDDDDDRRGRPSVHVQFDQATAILAGDALLAFAFEVLAAAEVPVPVMRRLAVAAGSRALVGGQADDLAFAPDTATFESVTSIHRRKTAALFGFSVGGAARTLTEDEQSLRALDAFAEHYGLAFQALDDLHDGDREECSILVVLDPAETREYIQREAVAAQNALDSFGAKAKALRELAGSLVAANVEGS